MLRMFSLVLAATLLSTGLIAQDLKTKHNPTHRIKNYADDGEG